MTNEEYVDQVTCLGAAVINAVHQQCQQPDHQLVMDALMSAYVSVAKAHPCCTQRAARMARAMADLIEINAVQDAAHLH